MFSDNLFRVSVRSFVTLGLLAALIGCGSTDKVKPAELGRNPASLGVKAAWSNGVGRVTFPLDIKAVGNTVYVAGADGTVAALDGRTGGDVWRVQLKSALTAGVGTDGRFAAVVSRDNELIAVDAGREIWRAKLGAITLTAPLVAGERIFVSSADRSVTAFDAVSGRRLWQQQRTGEALVLRQGGVLVAVGDTLVAGLGGRLVGMNPQNGSVRWEVPVANSRGTNEVERLVDLVAGSSRSGDQLCVRAFQSAVSCVDAARGSVVWTKQASGGTGIGGDGNVIYGSETDGTLIAWRRSDGEKMWSQESLKFRGLTAPLLVGGAVVVGDFSGLLHFMSKAKGETLNRVSTDGSPIVAGPVLVGATVVVATQRGGVFGFRPE